MTYTYIIETLEGGWIGFSCAGTVEELEEVFAAFNAIISHRINQDRKRR